jgi:hypothetical protein
MFQPTPEQQKAIDLFAEGGHLAIQAGAGCGKSTVLRAIAHEYRDRRVAYTAFNKAICQEQKGKMGRNVRVRTMHGFAFDAVGREFSGRSNVRRTSAENAKALGINEPVWVPQIGGGSRALRPAWLASYVLRALGRFCQSDAEAPSVDHFRYVDGIDAPDSATGKRTYKANDMLRARMLPALNRAWEDAQKTNGVLPYSPAHFLKMWELGLHPSRPGVRRMPWIGAEILMIDEAQDMSPIMLSIIKKQMQLGSRVVLVGDSAQAINSFNGCLDAFKNIEVDRTAYLSQSFRFGQDLADFANTLLAQLDTPLRLKGRPGSDDEAGYIGPCEMIDAILCRTNATAVSEALTLMKAGRKVHLVGNTAQAVVSFARGAIELRDQGWTAHPELSCFSTWGQVQDYCLAPETRVLTSDLRWQTIDTLEPGDRLVGFDEETPADARGRRYRTAVVESVKTITRPCYRITTDDGTTVTASAEHRWIVQQGNNLRWMHTERLSPGTPILTLGRWEEEDTKDAGWLAGMFDGEGSAGCRGESSRNRHLSISQKEGPVLERVRSLLKDRGFEFGDYAHGSAPSEVRQLVIRGGLSEQLRLLGTTRPERLVAAAGGLWERRQIGRTPRTKVVNVEYVGEREVVAVRTDARTFIAEGLLSHNCEFDELGSDIALLVKLVEDFGPEAIIAGLADLSDLRAADVTVGTVHCVKGLEWDTVKLAADFPPPGQLDGNADELMLLYVAVTRARNALDVTACPSFAKAPDTVPAWLAGAAA